MGDLSETLFNFNGGCAAAAAAAVGCAVQADGDEGGEGGWRAVPWPTGEGGRKVGGWGSACRAADGRGVCLGSLGWVGWWGRGSGVWGCGGECYEGSADAWQI